MNDIAQALAPTDLLLWAWRSVVWVSAALMLALSALVFIRPALIHRLHEGFVASHHIDFLEPALRLIVSLAFIAVLPETKLPPLFFWSGAVLAITAIPMIFLHRFQRRQAARVVPFTKRILPLMGILGIALMWAIRR